MILHDNMSSSNVLEKEYSQYFGFTDDEVKFAIKESKVKHSMEEIRAWYNGYNFGGTMQ